MELEAGKRYVTRDGEMVKCIAVWTEEVDGFQATINFNGEPCEYTLDGRFLAHEDDCNHDHDIVSEYVEPKEPRRMWVHKDYGFALSSAPKQIAEDWIEFVEVIK